MTYSEKGIWPRIRSDNSGYKRAKKFINYFKRITFGVMAFSACLVLSAKICVHLPFLVYKTIIPPAKPKLKIPC